MPPAGADWRGKQLALLASQLHQRQSCALYADLIASAEAELEPDAPAASRRNLELLRLQLERQQRLDPSLVSNIAVAQARGNAVWQESRKADDFNMFAPALQELVGLRQEQARQLAEPRSSWESLAQPFEPDITKARLNELFTPLKQRLPQLLSEASSLLGPTPSADASLSKFDQERLGAELLDSWGYEPEHCQRGHSAHPFSCTLGPSDFRITTRVVPGEPFSAFLATAHEWGHSLYEQGLPRIGEHYFPWPLGDATSMGVHESQSLFWECRVARSEAFARRWFPRFQAVQTNSPWSGASGFWRALNPMQASLIRVEADELSYCLHIVLRFELELALIEGDMPIADLPEQWNQHMQKLLGLRPPSDRDGCLQDIHWAEGMFGYFPSYALGHLISAQLCEAMEQDLGPIEGLIASGDEQCLHSWLAQHVYPLGRSVNCAELVERVSGAPLSAHPFLRYMENKLIRLGTLTTTA